MIVSIKRIYLQILLVFGTILLNVYHTKAIDLSIKKNAIVGAVTYSITSDNEQNIWSQFPVITLDGSKTLSLSFDLLEAEQRQLAYRITRRRYDWSVSKLQEGQYLSGFNECIIPMPLPSQATLVDYCHYTVKVNANKEDIGITRAGNYVLSFYDRNGDGSTIFEFPFAVIDDRAKVNAYIAEQPKDGHFSESQGVNVNIGMDMSRVYNPRENIKVVVLQNGRWDNADILGSPSSISNAGLNYEGQSSALFEGSNQFYKIEHLGDRTSGMGVNHIYMQDDIYHVELFDNYARAMLSYTYEKDQFGRQVIRSSDFDYNDSSGTNADYQMLHFTFVSPYIKGGDILLSGEAFRYMPDKYITLEYDSNNGVYTADVLLKMGYQEYKYLFRPISTYKLESQYTCGNYYQTNNDYTILVYQNDLQYNADELIGYYSFKISE